MILIFFSYICSIMTIDNIKSELVIVIGDSHANYNYIKQRIKLFKLKNVTFLHVGDFGVGFIPEHKDIEILKRFDEFLLEHNCTLYSIRGNHDKPKYFDGKWSNQFSNIFLVEDYTVLNINDENYLLVGGAISIDRKINIEKMVEYPMYEKYWIDESFVLREDLLNEMNNITYVITHSCPDMIEPYNYVNNSYMSHGLKVESMSGIDPELKNDINNERINITKMYDILKQKNNIKNWYFGHFHRSQRQDFENTVFYTLDINEFKEVR